MRTSCHILSHHPVTSLTSCAWRFYHRGSHDQTAASYAQAYNDAIPLIRSVYTGALVLDLPGWGQETRTAGDASPLLADPHLVFSAHIYPQAYNQAAGRYVIPADMTDLLQQSGRPCIIGEFGDIEASSVESTLTAIAKYVLNTAIIAAAVEGEQCDVKAVVEVAKESGFQAVYGWAWNGDGGQLNMLAPSWSEAPTAEKYGETDYFWTILNLL